MDKTPPMPLQFACPFSGPNAFRSDGFLGAWSPTRSLAVEGDPADCAQAAYLRGPNWFLCSAVAATPSGHWPKIHVDRQQDRGLAFRGYVVNPALHHFSAPADLWHHWEQGGGRYPNGVFATAFIEGQDNRLTLKTDAFGFSPLYYRVHGDLVLFGTKPDFLVVDEAEPDELGVATVMAHSYPLGDRTLLRDVHRCPFGAALRFEGSVAPTRDTWFAADDLPEPDQPLDDAGVARAEEAFNQAVRRCTGLEYGQAHLPLSSGYDSRRILATLLNDGTPFRSTTVRVFRNGARDLDARYAAEMAAQFGFEHRVVDLPPPEEYARDDGRRQREVCAETRMHDGWVESLIRALPAEPTAVIDGFLGDVLGYPGYRLPDAVFEDPEADIERIAEDIAQTPLARHVSEAYRPGAAARDELREYLAPLASKHNVSEFAYMLLRQRRGTALWSQQLMPPEHLATLPYTDLDYIRTVAALRPQERCATHLQRICLQRFHPQLAAVAGSHAIPPDAEPVGQEGNRQRSLACIQRLAAGALNPNRNGRVLRGRLTPVGQAITAAGWLSPGAITRWHWMLRPVGEALLHDREVSPVWHSYPAAGEASVGEASVGEASVGEASVGEAGASR